MNELSATRIFVRRILLLAIIGCLLLLAGSAGWRALLDRAGGRFDHAPEDARWVLSDKAQALIDAAFADVGEVAIMDNHVAVMAGGQLRNHTVDDDSYYRRDRQGAAGPLAWLVTRLRLQAAGVDNADAIDGAYMSRLLRQIDAMPGPYHVRLLARGWRYDDQGRRDETGTYTHVANAYVWWLAQQAPAAIVPTVSIHPYRQDALQRLVEWVDKGVTDVVWWPVRQNIDLDDPRTLAFYQAMAKHDLALHVPVGTVETVYESGNNRIAVEALQPALAANVSVFARVAGGGTAGQRRRTANRLLRLARNDGDLYMTLAGALSQDSGASVLMTLLQHPQLYRQLRYASTYPLSAVNRRIDLQALASRGFIKAVDIVPLREIYHLNPLLFAYTLWRTVRLPQTLLQLPASVFTGERVPAAKKTEPPE